GWAAEAELRCEVACESLGKGEALADGLRSRRAAVSGSLEGLRVRAREESLARAELRIRARVLEERMREEMQADPGETVERWGHRLEVEDESRLTDPMAKVAATGDEALAKRRARLEREVASIGRVNALAAQEFESLSERERFLSGQMADLRASRRDLLRLVTSVDERVRDMFEAAFRDVSDEYERLFPRLFVNGRGRLRLTDPSDLLGSGVDVEARPAGKNVRRLSLLSGGERALAALAVLFAIFRARPSPFYILDEVEAALDDLNLARFLGLLEEFRESAQLLVITHQRRTMECANVLYGVSIRPDGSSRVICERLAPAAGALEVEREGLPGPVGTGTNPGGKLGRSLRL
ncbi:MAG: AAA family ATPase, partial [Candidatus Methylomirabilales bacterium]